MSYQIFALKWRPQNFDEIIGQEHITTTLKNAILKNRLANAYLFAGPHGVGKTSTARILSKGLNCKNGLTINPCQKCPSCIEISQSRSLDVIEIDGASNRGIDEIRTLREHVKFAPALSRYKVYIIDEVHMLTSEAFNALLKTLEEPPEFVKFIFATTQPHKVLPTVLSRCQRFNFKRITSMEISGQLKRIIKNEKIDIQDDVIFAIAKASAGSLRDAESILDQLISFSKDKLSINDVSCVLGLIKEDMLFDITNKIIRKDSKAAIELLTKIIDEGQDPAILLMNLIEHFRNLMVAKVSNADQILIDLPAEACQRLYQQCQAFSLQEIMHLFNILVNTQEMAKRLNSVQIPLEINLIKLSQEKVGPSFPEQIKKQNKSEPQPLPPKQEIKSQDPPENNTKTNIPNNLDNIKEHWQEIIDSLKKIKMSVATYLEGGLPVKLENNILTVAFPKNYSFHKEFLEKKENKFIIEKAIGDLFKTKIRLNLILSKEEIPKDKTENSPLFKSVLNVFNAKPLKEG